VMEYIDPQVLRPEHHKKIYITEDWFPNPFYFSTFGRKKLFARLYFDVNTANTQNDPQYAPVFQIAEYDGSYDYSNGAGLLDGLDVGTLVLGSQPPSISLTGVAVSFLSFKEVEFSAEDLPAFVGILARAESTNPIGPEGVIVLE